VEICRICEVELTDKNWYPSLKKRNSKLCKNCNWIKEMKRRKGGRDDL